MYTKDN